MERNNPCPHALLNPCDACSCLRIDEEETPTPEARGARDEVLTINKGLQWRCGLWCLCAGRCGAVTLLPLRRPHARKNELLPDMNQQTHGDGTTQQNPASRTVSGRRIDLEATSASNTALLTLPRSDDSVAYHALPKAVTGGSIKHHVRLPGDTYMLSSVRVILLVAPPGILAPWHTFAAERPLIRTWHVPHRPFLQSNLTRTPACVVRLGGSN